MAQDQTLFTDDELKKILDEDMLELMGAKNMPDEQKATLYEKMATDVQDRVMMRIYDSLTDEERDAFAAIIDTGDQAKTNEYLLGKNINVPQLMVQEAMFYKLDMMALLKLGKNNNESSNKE